MIGFDLVTLNIKRDRSVLYQELPLLFQTFVGVVQLKKCCRGVWGVTAVCIGRNPTVFEILDLSDVLT